MNTIYFNTIPATVRTKALAAKPKPKPKHNPYLFDVRKDKELIDLLVDAADNGDTVFLPVGAYLIDETEAVDNCYPGGVTWVLVSPKGEACYCMDDLHNEPVIDWNPMVHEYLGIEPKKSKKTTKKAKKTQTTKRSKR